MFSGLVMADHYIKVDLKLKIKYIEMVGKF